MRNEQITEEVRLATVKDVADVKDVLHETWHDTYGPLLPASVIERIASEWHSVEGLEREVRNPEIFFAVGVHKSSNVIAVLSARAESGAVVVDRLYVRPLHQRQGIGKELLEASYDAFPAASNARVTVEAENGTGVRSYLKQGFVEVERQVEDVLGVRLEGIVMERKLDRHGVHRGGKW